MKIIAVEGQDLALLALHLGELERVGNLRTLRVMVRNDQVEFKINGGMWWPGVGTVEVDTDRPDPNANRRRPNAEQQA